MRHLSLTLAALALAPSLLVCQAGSPAGPVPVERLQARRAALLGRIGKGIAVLRSADERSIEGDYPQDSDYREDNDFFYLTGLEAPGGWLVLASRDTAPPDVILYLPARDTLEERWTGTKLGPGPEATALTGISDVRSSDGAEADIRRMVGAARRRSGRLFLKLGERAVSDAFLRELALGSGAGAVDLRPELAALRVVKDEDEMRRLRRAINISTEGHLAAMRAAKPGAWEYELEAAAEGTFRRLGAERLGYPSIVGTGFNGTTLHYDKSRSQIAEGDLIVMDMGAEFGYYSADVTRTIPATGKFTSRQRAIYDLVLATQQAAIDSVRPGITMSRLGQIAREFMRAHSGDLCPPGTCDRYFIHGLGHWIGMDVHDAGDYAQPLAPGMVLTIEPGIYIPEERLGVRIEDDILVTATGHELLSAGAPRKADEVEKAMR
jgi:Xaa-Pro aminopeptidase